MTGEEAHNSTARALEAVDEERCRQDIKWGTINNFDDRPLDRWLTILVEEVGELAEGIQNRDQANIEEEATQVAAVAVAILESVRRRPVTERK